MKNILFSLLVFFTTILFTSCCTRGKQRSLDEAARSLDRVEKSLNYWGQIAVSDLVLVEDKGQLRVNYDESVSNYVEAARVNISSDARSTLASSQYLGLALEGQFAPPVSMGSAATAGPTNAAGQVSIPNQAQTAMSNFTPALNVNGLSPVIDERQAVSKGINDKTAELLLKFMTNPEALTNQQTIVLGVMQVTCQPGQLTRRGYMADLSIIMKYGRQRDPTVITNNITSDRADRCGVTNVMMLTTNTYDFEITNDINPTALGVLPLMDSRNVELRNSNRRQTEFAAAVSAAFAAKGMSAGAKLLADYVKQQESDVDTRNSLPVATTYSEGATFGVQIYPSLQALRTPAAANGRPGDVFQPITFPVVVAIILNKDEYMESSGASATSPDKANGSGQQGGDKSWKFLVTERQARWIPLQRPEVFSASDKTFTSQQRERARDMDSAARSLKNVSAQGERFPDQIPENYRHQYTQLRIALDVLQDTALGLWTARPLPDSLFSKDTTKTNAPGIIDVFPHIVWRDTDTTFTILVTNLNSVSAVTIAGIECRGEEIHSDRGTAVRATLPSAFSSVTNGTSSVEFVLSGKEGQATKTMAMALQGRVAPEAVATISRENGKVSGVDIKPGRNLTEKELLDAVKEVLEKSEAPPKTTTIVP